MEERKAASCYEVASATSANFEIEVREYKDFPNVYRLCFISRLVKAPPISLEFTLPNFEILREALPLLQAGCAGNECQNVVILGQCFGRNVTLAQDDDWLQRFFIAIRDNDFPLGDRLTFTIAGEEVENFVVILQTVVDELGV
jgi:hypothetical protein